jgi:hypothetical protein
MRHPLTTFLAACLLAGAGAAGGWYLLAEPTTSAREVAGPARARAVPVETAVAAAGRAATLVRATGSLRSSDSVVVSPELAGRVNGVLFEQGLAVETGTPGKTSSARSPCRAAAPPPPRRWTRRARICALPRRSWSWPESASTTRRFGRRSPAWSG